MGLANDFNRIYAKSKRKSNGENINLISHRQRKRLKAWVKKYRTEIIFISVLVLYQFLDVVSWAFWATALVFAAIAFRRWWRRAG